MKAATCGWSNLVMFQVQHVKDTLHIILLSLYMARTDWLSLVQAAAKRDLTFVRLTTMCPKCLQVCCHMLSPVFFKPAMSPTKSNSGSFRDVFNNDLCVCVCVFFLHLHEQKEEDRGRLLPGVAFVWVLPLRRHWTAERLMKPSQVRTNGAWLNVRFGLGCLWTDGTALQQKGKFNKRQRENTARVRGRERKKDRTHLHIIPGWFESLRNKRITLNGLDVLYPSHLLL